MSKIIPDTRTDNNSKKVSVVPPTIVGPETRFKQSSSSGLKLYCCYWRPTTAKVRGLAFVCHGYSEHLQWYEDLALRLSSLGILAFGHDHVGHGRSEGIRGHVSYVEDYVKDVLNHCEEVQKDHIGKPCFIIGHSLGGLIAIRAAMAGSLNFAGVVLMGPLIKPNPKEATKFKICVTKVLANMVPLLPVEKLKLNYVTRDEEMKSKLSKDPLRYHGGVRARFAIACLEELFRIEEAMESITWPFFLLHGLGDQICSPEASQEFYKNARSSDKKMKMFPDAHHNLFIEIPEVRREALEDTVEWLRERLPKDDI